MLTLGASGRIGALFSPTLLRSLWLLVNAFSLVLLLPFRGRRICLPASDSGSCGKEEMQGKVVSVLAPMVPRKSVVDKEVAARWALSIKRVVEDNINSDGDIRVALRDFSLFSSSRGDTLFTQS